MSALEIRTLCERDAPIEECREMFAAHPEIAAHAPRWARTVSFDGIFEDGYVGWIYEYSDENVEIRWGWTIENGVIAHGKLEPDPDTSLSGDTLFELIADYVERTEAAAMGEAA
ncbi:hypothetical protein [Microbacterium hydrocarbonoxydans]|uniref:hypothetical protein n=1 Tax=Microbacterium hydrocarbonoxydans TaxID=273678 RepID=UPI002040F0AE|nr:hypothetical protein [Microbacterium hydrocarbonoxydans]MCM3779873.1 hypothetical protein [Microbacterium hydrocarbonoxydans]